MCVCAHICHQHYMLVCVCVCVHDATSFARDKHMLYSTYVVCVCVHTYAIIIILTLIGKLQWCMYAVYVSMWVYVYGDTSCLKRECVALLKEPQWNKSHLLYISKDNTCLGYWHKYHKPWVPLVDPCWYYYYYYYYYYYLRTGYSEDCLWWGLSTWGLLKLCISTSSRCNWIAHDSLVLFNFEKWF